MKPGLPTETLMLPFAVREPCAARRYSSASWAKRCGWPPMIP